MTSSIDQYLGTSVLWHARENGILMIRSIIHNTRHMILIVCAGCLTIFARLILPEMLPRGE